MYKNNIINVNSYTNKFKYMFNTKKESKIFPIPNCKPYYNTWLQCIDTKDNCCGANKCRFFFQEWQNCDKYSDQVRAHNARYQNSLRKF